MQISVSNCSPHTREAANEAFIPLMRELVKAYQAFSHYSAEHIRNAGLTPPQFDVISTLGNTQGMPLHLLAEKTLITKGTLTGVIDRLEHKGLLQRVVPADNRRSFMAVLTPAGEDLFDRIFPAHIAYLKERFGTLSGTEMEGAIAVLKRVRELF